MDTNKLYFKYTIRHEGLSYAYYVPQEVIELHVGDSITDSEIMKVSDFAIDLNSNKLLKCSYEFEEVLDKLLRIGGQDD